MSISPEFSSIISAQAAAKALTALGCLAIGFTIGACPWTSCREVSSPDTASKGNNEGDDGTTLVDEEADGDFAKVKAKTFEQCKLVLVVRTDLKLEPGDISTQSSAATLACYKALSAKNAKLVRHWEVTGQAKIALKGKSEEHLLELEANAKNLNLCARCVHNEHLTKGKGGDRTVLGIGPAPVELINQVTGKLKLL